MTVKLRYLASVRDMAGLGEEDLQLPGTVVTVTDLMQWLALRHSGLAETLTPSSNIRVAIDHEIVQRDTAIQDAREIAFFPPFTGG